MDAPLTFLSLWRQVTMQEIIDALPPQTFFSKRKAYLCQAGQGRLFQIRTKPESNTLTQSKVWANKVGT
jgi:hypothetical protein